MTASLEFLVADDNEINLWVLREQLSCWTEDIALANDGREAWRLLQQTSYTLVFLDLNMPFLNGFDLVEKLRAGDGPNFLTPVIAVTAHAQEQQRLEALDAGFDDYLVKPIRLAQLQGLVRRWLPNVDGDVDYYAGRLLHKTRDDRSLSRSLLSKLFTELPMHLLDIEQALQNMAIQQAWEVVHKLHGVFCFYDFADCLVVVERLEQALLLNDAAQADQQFSALKIKLTWLLNNQDAVLQRLSLGDGQRDTV